MKIIIDDNDRDSITDILDELSLIEITLNNPDGDITPTAIQIMLYLNAFLLKDGEVLRTPQEIADLVSLGSFKESIQNADPDELESEVISLIRYAITINRQYAVNMIVGLDVAISAIYYALHHTAFAKIFSLLSWRVVNRNEDNVLTLGPLKFKGRYDGQRNYLLEGLLAGLVMYPQIPYQVAIGNAILIPTLDSELQLRLQKSRGRKYAIRVPGTNFTGQYLRDIISENRRRGGVLQSFSPREGYLLFDDPIFLQGLLSITALVGITQPWLSLDINIGNNSWVPASIVST